MGYRNVENITKGLRFHQQQHTVMENETASSLRGNWEKTLGVIGHMWQKPPDCITEQLLTWNTYA